MGAARRLQNEIEAVLKKVKEGVASFDDTHAKLMALDAPQQREKLVASLKDQIKKLQKDRDKIKTWASDKDVRDKKHLTDARAMIERRMEKFKECEKELKVKDFSKVGLEKGAKLDPKQLATDERREWIRSCVERIDATVELNEAELDSILSNVKRGKDPPARAGRIQTRNALHKKHTERLEQVLRALDNEAISVDQVDGLKEAIEDYLENGNNSGEDGFYDEVDVFYDEEILTIIDSVDVHVPIVTERVAPRVPDHAEKPDKKNREKDRELERARKEEREKEREKEKAEKQAAAARAALAPSKGHSAYQSEEKTAAQQRAAAIAVTQPPPPPPPRTGAQPASSLLMNSAGLAASSSQQSEPSTTTTAARTAAAPVGSAWVGASPSAASTAAPASSVSTAAPSVVDASPTQQPAGSGSAPNLPSPTPAATAAVPAPPAPPAAQQSATTAAPPGLPLKAASAQELPVRAEASTGVPASAQLPPLEPGSIMMTLQDKQPHPFDSVWLRHPCARRTKATAPRPPSYPTVPPATLDNPRFYSNITKDTDIDLFYIFYLTPGTQYQYLAACELRQRNWRYHKEEKAWFQRAEMPSESTSTYEKGDYVYFDPTCQTDTSWVLRFKKDFKVEYSMVEDDTWCEAYSVMTQS